MAHPHHAHRQHAVEHSRVAKITKGYATGGGVGATPAAKAPRAASPSATKTKLATGGAVPKVRMDRVKRARGGRTKAKGTNVNVIIAPQGGQHGAPPMAVPPGLPPMPPGGPGGPPPGMAPRPMMPPPGAGMPPPGGPAPGMIRNAGGRTYKTGGRVKSGPAWEEGKRNGTQVQNNPSGFNDVKDMNRGKPITYKTGGAIYSSAKGQMGPKFKGGAGGGEARIEKEERAAKRYKKA